jgi:GT2 family glycosyltransferase
MRLAVLITCYNRISVTLGGLGALRSGLDPIADLDYEIFLVDDASADGTADAIRGAHPDVHVIEGTGSLFWNGGMCRAFREANRVASFDAYLLFNDDVTVSARGVADVFEDFRQANLRNPAIVAASTTSQDGTSVTYTGFRQTSRIRPRAFDRVYPNGTMLPIDVFNGNFVLVPGPFFEAIGGLDPGYVHSLGDLDLGLVAKAKGINIWLARHPVGSCDANTLITKTFKNASFRKRLKMLQHPRLRPNDFFHYVWKHKPIVLYPCFVVLFHIKRIRSLFIP